MIVLLVKILLKSGLKALHSLPQDPAPPLGFHLSNSSTPTLVQPKAQGGGLEVKGKSHRLWRLCAQ